jgi:hypothetical protein
MEPCKTGVMSAMMSGSESAGDVSFESKATLMALKSNFRSSPESRLRSDIVGGPFRADFVAKVENRSAAKNLRKLIFGLLCFCVAFQRD